MNKKYILTNIKYFLLFWSIFIIVCLILDKLNSFNFISLIAGALLFFLYLRFKYEDSK